MRRIAPLRMLALALVVAGAAGAAARAPDDPITLGWVEGDVAGHTPILGPDGGRPIGVVVYQQHRRGDVLECRRVSRFTDGSSDEDTAVARVGRTLDAVRGRSIIRDTQGKAVVDLQLDVAGGHVSGFYESGGLRTDVDEKVSLGPGTYWGPLVFMVVKNFDANADGDRLRFRTIAPTPKPRVLTMELVHTGSTQLQRMGENVSVERYTLKPTLGWLIDPIVQRFVPTTEFFVEPGQPPSLARYAGPRNYQGQEILLE